MANEAEAYIEKLRTKVRGLQDEIKKTKLAANAIAEIEGMQIPYQKVDEEDVTITTSFKSDDFYGQPLAKCVRRVLEARRAMGGGPASIAEIHDSLVSGGYRFETKDDANSKSSLRVSMSKNPLFHKLPNGGWGLLAWYPKAKPMKENGTATEKPADATGTPPTPDTSDTSLYDEGGDEK